MTDIKAVFRKKLVWFVIVAVLVCGGYLYNKSRKASGQTVSYITQNAAIGTVVSSITGSGQISAQDQVDLKPMGSGTVTAVKVSEGQAVKSGTVIATIDERAASAQISQAQAALLSAEAAYDKLVNGPTSNDLASSQLSVQSAQQQLDQAKQSYDNTVTEQNQALAKSHSDLLNSGLSATPSDSLTSATLTLSGTYTGNTEGQYIISLYQGGDGTHYGVTGLGNETDLILRGTQQPLGNGLYVTFSTTGTISLSTTWTIDVPNKKSSDYFTNANAYASAQQNQAKALQQAQNSINSAQISLQQAQIALNTKTASPTKADVTSAQAQIASARVSLQNAQNTYSGNIVTAPFDGVVAKLNVHPGDQATSATIAATMISPQQLAVVTLNEVDVAKIKNGDKATLTFDAISDLTLTGKVVEIDQIGTVSQGVVSYSVKISPDTPNDQIKPGMSVTASIITDVATDVLMVPNSAVKTGASGSYVQILGSDGKPQNQAVQTGLTSDTDTEITGGLKAGDKVVTQTINPSATTASPSSASRTGSGIGLPGLGGGGFGGGVNRGGAGAGR